MSLPKTLLLSSTRPGTCTVGEIFLRPLCGLFPEDRLVCYAMTGGYDWPMPAPELSWLPIKTRPLPPQWPSKIVGAGWRSALYAPLHIPLLKRRLQPYINEAVEYAKTNDVELIWAVLNSPAMVLMARAVAERLNKPLVTLVWDPMDWEMIKHDLDPGSRKALFDEFDRVQRLARYGAVASENMKDVFKGAYNLSSVVLIHAPDKIVRREIGHSSNNNGEFVIGFAGYIYARAEFQILINTLASTNWELSGRPVRLRIIGLASEKFSITCPARIDFLGYHPIEDTVSILSQCDLGYLPYWFDIKYAKSAHLCFPNKLPTYLAAGLPILYHGPPGGSPQRFIEKYPVGLTCNVHEPQQVLPILERFVKEPQLNSVFTEARQRALSEEFSQEVMKARFAEFLGVDTKDFANNSNIDAQEFVLSR